MTRRTVVLALIVSLGMAAAFAWVQGGSGAAVGTALGAVAATLSAAGTAWVTSLAAQSASDESRSGRASIAVVVLLMLKFPLFLALAALAWRLGTPGLIGFLAATALVYSATVGWALAKG